MCYLFFGYYIGTDFFNYYKICKNHEETLNKLAEIEYKLETIESKIK